MGIQALKHNSQISEMHVLWGKQNVPGALSGCMDYRNCIQSGFAEAKEKKL